ncbi:nitroreductase [Lucifera butyrica]|uniref:Nitroreductase n=1 Tax=Lucifera butyrica TaxID=1351585 RepID=A0A498R9C9_9FIRM|nr:nitroreductase family protein [Lucifera butyrica]VBB07557.1 nitroreductase [Lucifera butyrica]
MDLIQVDRTKCTRCGICAKVCPIGSIGMDEHGPKALGQFCITCGHCVAICPSDALDNVKTPLANQIPLKKAPVLDEDTATLFLRSRRSVREFQTTPVPREKIRQLLDIAKFAPTSGNSQGVSYYVIDDRDTLRRITAVTIDWLEKALQSPPYAGSRYAAPFAAHVANYRQNGQDIVLRDAPCLVIPIADKNSLPTGRDNTLFSLAYAELFAPTIGLGTCITGFFNACAASGYQPLLDMLNLPENMHVTGGLMVGYPKYTYRRLVDRNPLQVTWQ